MNYFGKHLTFGSSGVINTENQQFQMIPSYGFQSKNANGSIRFPIVYDHKQKLLFADLSALSGLLTDVENEGKYSKFSTANLPIPADADVKLVQLMRKYATVFYDDLKPEAFVDLPVLLVLKAGKEKLFFILILWILTAVGFILGIKKTKYSRLALNRDAVVKAEKTLIVN